MKAENGSDIHSWRQRVLDGEHTPLFRYPVLSWVGSFYPSKISAFFDTGLLPYIYTHSSPAGRGLFGISGHRSQCVCTSMQGIRKTEQSDFKAFQSSLVAGMGRYEQDAAYYRHFAKNGGTEPNMHIALYLHPQHLASYPGKIHAIGDSFTEPGADAVYPQIEELGIERTTPKRAQGNKDPFHNEVVILPDQTEKPIMGILPEYWLALVCPEFLVPVILAQAQQVVEKTKGLPLIGFIPGELSSTQVVR